MTMTLGSCKSRFAGERIQSNRCSGMIVFDAVEVNFAKGDPTALGVRGRC